MSIRLITFDLDGTILDDDKRLPEENRLALTAAAERGVVLVPATGRIVRGVPESIRCLPFVRYYIVSNGAQVYDAGEDRILYHGDIPAELAVRVCEYMDTLPVLYDCYQNDMGWMSRDHYERLLPFFTEEPHMRELVERLRVRVDDLKETLAQRGEPVQKLQMYFRPEELALRPGIMAELPRRFPGLTATTSVSNNIEINSDRAGKGKASATAPTTRRCCGWPAAAWPWATPCRRSRPRRTGSRRATTKAAWAGRSGRCWACRLKTKSAPPGAASLEEEDQ